MKEITVDTIPAKSLFFSIISNKFKNLPLCKYLCGPDFIDTYYIAFYNAKKNFKSNGGATFGTYVYSSIINAAYKNLK